MLRSLKDIGSFTINATDGDIGSVVNFLFDDNRWAIRYLVAESSGFIGGRQVLISPISFRTVDWATRTFHLALTKAKIKNSPSIDTKLPVSRQHEQDYYQYYGYPYYWGFGGIWGMGNYPGMLSAGSSRPAAPNDSNAVSGDPHLRSAMEVQGYHIQGSDDAIGHIDDFIVDDASWEIRYLVVDTRNWWFGKKVLISPHWATRIRWEERKVFVDLPRQAIKNSPEWNATAAAITQEYETRLQDHYGRRAFWVGGEEAIIAQERREI